MLCPGQVMGQPGEGGEVWGEEMGHRDIEEGRGGECGKCSVPQWPVALGYGVRDLEES